MTCDSLPDGAFFQFMNSGVTVEPEEVDYRSKKKNYAHCQFHVREELGEIVEQKYNPAEPVHFIIDGNRAHRFYAPNELVEYRRTLDKPTRAKVSLLDAQQVLQRGTIEKSWATATFEEIVEYIFENRDDPYNVIKEYVLFSDDEIREDKFGQVSFGAPGEIRRKIPTTEFVESIATFLSDNIKELEPISEAFFTEPVFDGVSPATALQRVTSALNQWTRVDNRGRLLIGDFGGVPREHGIGLGDGIRLSRYDIVASSNMTNAVRFIGSGADKFLKNVKPLEPQSRLRPVAEASVPSVSGSPIEITSEDSKFVKKIQNIASLKNAAVRTLISELAADSGGSLVINGLASENKKSLAEMAVGDKLVVDPQIKQLCDGVVTTGFFVINRVQHKMNSRRGWSATLEVAQSTTSEQIDVQTFWYDPQTEQRFDSLESFNEYNNTEPVTEEVFGIENIL
jgi:hypothetical protein